MSAPHDLWDGLTFADAISPDAGRMSLKAGYDSNQERPMIEFRNDKVILGKQLTKPEAKKLHRELGKAIERSPG